MHEPVERAWAEVDLGAIADNVKTAIRLAGENSRLMAVVKANAYGHGAVDVARTAIKAGATSLGVASIGEAYELRDAGVMCPISLLGAVLPEGAAEVVDARLECMVTDEGILTAVNSAAARRGIRAQVHLKFDTGMGRLGASESEAPTLIRAAADSSNIRVAGLATQLSSADSNPEYTWSQLNTFSRIARRGREILGYSPHVHAANSAAALLYPEARLDMVRAGLLIYGIIPVRVPEGNLDNGKSPARDLRPALSLRTRVVQVKRMPAGSRISYGGVHTLEHETLVGTLAVGYADGFPRGLTGKAEAIVRGKRVPIIGNICMDLAMVDLTGIPDAEAGDTATLIGRDGNECISAWELAEAMDTTVHEVTTRIGPRVPRFVLSRPRPATESVEESAPAVVGP